MERLPRVAELGFEDARERRLGEAHGAHHELWWDLAARPLSAVAVGQGHTEDVIRGALARRDLGRFPEPAREAVLPALDALEIGRAVLALEEVRGGGEGEEVIVEGRGQRRLVLQHQRRGPADPRHVVVPEADEGHLLRDESQHVGAGRDALGLAHGSQG